MAGFKSGLFWGAVFGGLAGLMNAPRKGSETRADLKVFIEQTKADANDLKYKADHLQTVVNQLQGEGMKQAQDVVTDIQTLIRQFMENNQPRINRIQRRIGQLQQNIEENLNN